MNSNTLTQEDIDSFTIKAIDFVNAIEKRPEAQEKPEARIGFQTIYN